MILGELICIVQYLGWESYDKIIIHSRAASLVCLLYYCFTNYLNHFKIRVESVTVYYYCSIPSTVTEWLFTSGSSPSPRFSSSLVAQFGVRAYYLRLLVLPNCHCAYRNRASIIVLDFCLHLASLQSQRFLGCCHDMQWELLDLIYTGGVCLF